MGEKAYFCDAAQIACLINLHNQRRSRVFVAYYQMQSACHFVVDKDYTL
jgi:hypothetical protein